MSGARTRIVEPARRLRGEIHVPGDKSITHRAYVLGSIGNGVSRIRGPGAGTDTRATATIISTLGIEHLITGDELIVRGSGLDGFQEPDNVLDCANSGTTIRLMAGLLAGQPFHSFLTGDPSLRRRPMARVISPLRDMGATIHGRADNTLAPIAIAPSSLHGARHTTPIASAQVKSAILLAGLRAQGPTSVTQPCLSRDHTERMLVCQGASITSDGSTVTCAPTERLMPLDLDVPGDFSSAAFWIVTAVTHPDAEIIIRGVGLNPTRTGLLDVLRAMGADITTEIEQRDPEPVGTVIAKSSSLRATDVSGDLVHRMMDEAMLFGLLATRAKGESRLSDAGDLASKESNRLRSMKDVLRALGAQFDETPDGFIASGGRATSGGRANAAGDHRIAMLAASAAVAGLGPVTIDGANCVDVSYPEFWKDMEALRR